MSVFMYGHNGRHFRLVALQKRPAARLAAIAKVRFKDRAGSPAARAPGAKPSPRTRRHTHETEPTEVTDTRTWYLYSRFRGWFCSCVCLR